MRGVYAILDHDLAAQRGFALAALAEAMLAAKPGALQLRAKSSDGGAMLLHARAIAALAARAGVPFFVNDRLDVALLVEGAGVHLGQHDLPPHEAAALAARAGRPLAIGLSTHGEEQLVASRSAPLAYVALGPFFTTATKTDHDPVLGLERGVALAAAARRARPTVPLVAIGGIDPERARVLRGAVDLVAVIGAITPGRGERASAAEARVREVAAAFGEAT